MGAPRVRLRNSTSFVAAYSALIDTLIEQSAASVTVTSVSAFIFDQLYDISTQCSGILNAEREVKGGTDTMRAVVQGNRRLLAAFAQQQVSSTHDWEPQGVGLRGAQWTQGGPFSPPP